MYKGWRFFKTHTNIFLSNVCQLRSKHFNKGLKFAFGSASSKNCFHQSKLSEYPATKQLPLPSNIKDLASSEKLKFSPQRNRDINGSFISCFTSSSLNNIHPDPRNSVDENIECYDFSGTVNLSSAMQSNVPFPFKSKGKPMHLNMPGGQWGQKEKYVSEDLNNTHHKNAEKLNQGGGITCNLGSKRGNKNFYFCFPFRESNFFNGLLPALNNLSTCQLRTFCSVKGRVEVESVVPEKKVTFSSRKEKLKAAVKDYGTVILLFHIGISLVSLGSFYLLVSSGVDMSYIFNNFGVSDGAGAAGTAAHFVVAYALHKSLAPVRISVTLTAAPFLVKKLRKIGILKTSSAKPQ